MLIVQQWQLVNTEIGEDREITTPFKSINQELMLFFNYKRH